MLALGVITGVSISQRTREVAAAEDELRDPFVFGVTTGSAAQYDYVLTGILWDAARPLAIMGATTLAVGDRIAGWLVVDIQRDQIIVQRGAQQEPITVGNPLPSD